MIPSALFLPLAIGPGQVSAGPGLAPLPALTRLAPICAAEPLQVRRTPAVKSSPLAGIKNVAVSIILLLGDTGDVFPRVASTAEMRRRSAPYLKDARLWTSPDGRPVIYNTALSGLRLTTLEDVSGTLLLWEERPAKNGTRAVAFADGHAKLATVAEWKKIWAAELDRRAKTRR